MAMKDPPYTVFKGLDQNMLPVIGHIPRIDTRFQDGRIEPASIDANLPYHQVLGWIAEQTKQKKQLLKTIEN